jgi:hypothetical protein
MAYMNQERKSKIQPVVKAILKRYGLKGSLSVRSGRTLVLNIKAGPIDFIDNMNKTLANDPFIIASGTVAARDYISVNPYHYRNQFTGEALKVIDELLKAMNNDNHDRSDIMTDYFDVGWYVDVNIGRWGRRYELIA